MLKLINMFNIFLLSKDLKTFDRTQIIYIFVNFEKKLKMQYKQNLLLKLEDNKALE